MSAPQLPVTRPARQSLAQDVASQLLGLIRSGTLKEGQKLPTESELKERFGVGRSTVREALNGLVLIGAIEVRHGQGAFVLPGREIQEFGSAPADGGGSLDSAIRESIVQDVLEAREAIEVAIARHAAERATEHDLSVLRELLAAAEERVQREGAAVEEGVRFHIAVAEAAKNPICTELVQVIVGDLIERGDDLRDVLDYSRWEVEAHRLLYDAIASGSGERAQREMTRHLADMRRILLEGWENFRDSASFRRYAG